MDGIVGPLKTIITKHDPARIDNFVFRLHYRVSVAFLLVCMALVSTTQYFGDPIKCIADGVPGGALDLFCWIHSTFSISSRLGTAKEKYGVGNYDQIGLNQPHPGVAPLEPGEEGDIVYHKYYQWVVFFLFFQATLFYIPRLLWKHSEGGLMKELVGDITSPRMPFQTEERKEQLERIKKYFKQDLRSHGGYAINFFLCEILALFNVIGMIYFTDRFLGNQFTTFGWDVVSVASMDPDQRYDPMDAVFPKVTKCTFHTYGPSGTINRHDSLCILALNIINEKIFVFLWFWFVLLAIISALALVYRIVILSVPSLRVRVIMKKLHGRVDQKIIEDLLNSPQHSWIDQIGDYWVFFLLSKNLPTIALKDVMEQIKPWQPSSDQQGYPTLDKE